MVDLIVKHSRDATSRLVGNGCRVGPAALQIVGPDIRSRGGIDQLKVHLERFVIALNVTDERVLHAEAGQHAGVGPEIAIGIGRGPGEHPQIAVAAKVTDNVVREELSEGRIGRRRRAVAGEGQNRDATVPLRATTKLRQPPPSRLPSRRSEEQGQR